MLIVPRQALPVPTIACRADEGMLASCEADLLAVTTQPLPCFHHRLQGGLSKLGCCGAIVSNSDKQAPPWSKHCLQGSSSW